ncbi:MAG TPA: FtsQ-type POTRA domain-containing protein [Myxococcota bacterium]|jgi:cell division septal protein FtsQ|nr:FtsQ-type POTRA domain-containing protein [Myxococcota bacterium]
MSAARRRRLRPTALAVTLLVLLGAAGGVAVPWLGPSLLSKLRHDWLALQHVAVAGAGRISSQAIAETTGLPLGVSLLDVDPHAAEARLRSHPWIREAHVMRLPPSTVVVSVELREPVALVEGAAPGEEWLVDATGRRFAPAEERDLASLPLLVPAVVEGPDGGPPDLAAGAEAALALARSSLPRNSQIHLPAPGDPEGMKLRVGATPAPIVLGTGGLDDKLARLARLLAERLPEVQAAAVIDLRFADQAVLRSPPLPEGAAKSAAAPGGARPPRDQAG